jgi:hypothetical protein
MSISGGSFGEQRMAGFIDAIGQKGIDTNGFGELVRVGRLG